MTISLTHRTVSVSGIKTKILVYTKQVGWVIECESKTPIHLSYKFFKKARNRWLRLQHYLETNIWPDLVQVNNIWLRFLIELLKNRER